MAMDSKTGVPFASSSLGVTAATAVVTDARSEIAKLGLEISRLVRKLDIAHPTLNAWLFTLRKLKLEIFQQGRAETTVKQWIQSRDDGTGAQYIACPRICSELTGICGRARVAFRDKARRLNCSYAAKEHKYGCKEMIAVAGPIYIEVDEGYHDSKPDKGWEVGRSFLYYGHAHDHKAVARDPVILVRFGLMSNTITSNEQKSFLTIIDSLKTAGPRGTVVFSIVFVGYPTGHSRVELLRTKGIIAATTADTKVAAPISELPVVRIDFSLTQVNAVLSEYSLRYIPDLEVSAAIQRERVRKAGIIQFKLKDEYYNRYKVFGVCQTCDEGDMSEGRDDDEILSEIEDELANVRDMWMVDKKQWTDLDAELEANRKDSYRNIRVDIILLLKCNSVDVDVDKQCKTTVPHLLTVTADYWKDVGWDNVRWDFHIGERRTT